MSMNILNDISKVYLEQVSPKPDFLDLDKDGNKKEPMKKAAKEVEPPKERLKTDRNMFSIPKDEQKDARERLLAKARAKREKMEESLRLVQEKKMSKEAHKKAAKAGKRWQDSDGDGKWYEPGEDVKESSHYDPMDDDDFDHDEAEENRGVSGKDNPKGGKTLGKKKKDVKEGFSNWRQDLSEVMANVDSNGKIKEKKVNNKIKINPDMKETVEKLGGELIEMVELDEKAYRGLGVGRVERVSSGSYQAPETTGSVAKRTPKPTPETKKPAALPPEQGRRAKKRRKGSPSYAEVKAQIDAKEKSRKPKRTRRSRLDSLLASIRNEEVRIDEMDFRIDPTAHRKQQRIEKATKLQQGSTGAESSAAGSAVKRLGGSGINLPLANSYELDGEQIDEIAPLAAGALAAGALAAPYLLKKFAKPKVDKALDTETQRIQKNRGLTQMNSYEPEGEMVDEKALSQQQQKFMGMVYAVKKGEMESPSPEVAKAAAGMTKKQARDFAKTKHEGLPKVKEEVEVIDERRREDKGTPRNDIGKTDLAYRQVKKTIRNMSGGRPVGQRKKEKGKKPPVAGEFGAPKSPAQKLADRRSAAKRSQDMMHSPRD